MNGLTVSIVSFSKLEKISTRIDPEYYRPVYLHLYRQLTRRIHFPIGKVAYVTDGIHESINFNKEREVKLVSAKVPKENFFDTSDIGTIDWQQHLKNPRTQLQVDDVIVSSVGTIGNCAVVDESILPPNSDRHVGIIRIQKDFQPKFLSTFLLSKYGRFQTLRESIGNVQLNLFIYKINEIVVPRLSDTFQQFIEETVQKANFLLKSSAELYRQATDYLLSELGLADWQPTQQTTFVRNFSEILQADRLDAEYFQPIMTEILDLVKQKDYMLLKEHAIISSGFPWKSQYFLESTEQGEPFVRIRDCKPGAIDIEEITRLEANYARSQRAKRGDLVIEMDGVDYFYASFIVDSCFVNQRVCQVRIKSDALITPEYLLLIINSKIGQTQLLREMTIAHTVGHITNEAIRHLMIPVLPSNIIQQISTSVKDSIKCKFDSKHLLDIAKRGVELAIEQDEQGAKAWMQAQIQALDIEVDQKG